VMDLLRDQALEKNVELGIGGRVIKLELSVH
jgi:hypothetical protein